MTATNSGNNSFGKFLSSLRLARGFGNVSEYLRSYETGISSVHYRHLESGERNISIEAAKQLCKGLQAEPKEFYFNLMSDWLPPEILNFLIPLSSSHDVEKLYRQAVMHVYAEQVLFPGDNACNYLVAHFDLLPVLWFVYSVRKASLADVQTVVLKHNISTAAKDIIDGFVQLGLVQYCDQMEMDKIERVRPQISFGHHQLSKIIVEHEAKALGSNALLSCSLVPLTSQSRQTIFSRIREFLRDVQNAAEETYLVSPDDAEPVYYSVVYAPRPK